jgi:hypothetical protein
MCVCTPCLDVEWLCVHCPTRFAQPFLLPPCLNIFCYRADEHAICNARFPFLFENKS